MFVVKKILTAFICGAVSTLGGLIVQKSFKAITDPELKEKIKKNIEHAQPI